MISELSLLPELRFIYSFKVYLLYSLKASSEVDSFYLSGGSQMHEPVSGTALTSGLGATTLLSYWAGVPSGVIIGSFAGAVVYVLTNSDIPLFKRLSFFLISFVVGIIGAGYASKIIGAITSALTQSTIDVDHSVGALVASAVAIKLLLSLIAKAKIPDLPTGGTK
jgi:glucan phosphoethanolaminetransferase (alkaline phosphatase superfamily)